MLGLSNPIVIFTPALIAILICTPRLQLNRHGKSSQDYNDSDASSTLTEVKCPWKIVPDTTIDYDNLTKMTVIANGTGRVTAGTKMCPFHFLPHGRGQ